MELCAVADDSAGAGAILHPHQTANFQGQIADNIQAYPTSGNFSYCFTRRKSG